MLSQVKFAWKSRKQLMQKNCSLSHR